MLVVDTGILANASYIDNFLVANCPISDNSTACWFPTTEALFVSALISISLKDVLLRTLFNSTFFSLISSATVTDLFSTDLDLSLISKASAWSWIFFMSNSNASLTPLTAESITSLFEAVNASIADLISIEVLPSNPFVIVSNWPFNSSGVIPFIYFKFILNDLNTFNNGSTLEVSPSNGSLSVSVFSNVSICFNLVSE